MDPLMEHQIHLNWTHSSQHNTVTNGWWSTLWESDPDCKEILKSTVEPQKNSVAVVADCRQDPACLCKNRRSVLLVFLWTVRTNGEQSSCFEQNIQKKPYQGKEAVKPAISFFKGVNSLFCLLEYISPHTIQQLFPHGLHSSSSP